MNNRGWASNTTVLSHKMNAPSDASIAERDQRAADEQARPQRELETLKTCVKPKDNGQKNNHSPRNSYARAAVYRAGAFVLHWSWQLPRFPWRHSHHNATEADQNAQAAINAQGTAVSNADAAQKSGSGSDPTQRLTLSRELAGNAIINLDMDPERSILLGMQAVTTTYAVDGRQPRKPRRHCIARC